MKVKPGLEVCDGCHKEILKGESFYLCDEKMESYCEACWGFTDCSKGQHGEGCPTLVINGA